MRNWIRICTQRQNQRVLNYLKASQSCRKLRTAHFYWQRLFFLWETRKADLGSAFSFVTLRPIENQENKITSWKAPQMMSLMLCLRESHKFNACKMLSTLPTKMTQESSTARMLQFSCDKSNEGKIKMSIEFTAPTKHIDVAHLWIQRDVDRESIKVWGEHWLGLISSKEMSPIIFCLLDLMCCPASGQLENRVLPIVIGHGSSQFRIQKRNFGFLKDHMHSIHQFPFRFWFWGRC